MAWFLIPKDSSKPDSVTVLPFRGAEGSSEVSAEIRVDPKEEISAVPLVSVVLTVSTKHPLRPKETYHGKLVFSWKAQKETSAFDYSVVEEAPDEVEIHPPRIQAFLGPRGPRTATVRVKNSGHRAIATLRVCSTGLTNAVTKETVQTGCATYPLAGPDGRALEVGASCDVSLSLPQPPWAGSYFGELDVDTSGRGLGIQHLPVEVQTRGPWGDTGAPLILLFLAAVSGLGLSQVLDAWESGDLKGRTEAVLEAGAFLKRLESAGEAIGRLGLTKNHQATAEARLRCQRVITGADGLALARLQGELSWLSGALERFEILVLEAERAPSDRPLLDRLDAIDGLGLSPDEYLKRLRSAGTPRDDSGGAEPMRPLSPGKAVARARARKALFSALGWGVGTAVFCGTVYAFYYQAKPSFGAFSDYLAVCLWSLGLTKTGSQVVSRFKR